MTVKIRYTGDFSELKRKHPQLHKISPRFSCNWETWSMTDSRYGYVDTPIQALQTMFIGKTGYGKSSTINRFVGRNVFETDAVCACTKELHTATYRFSEEDKAFLLLSDLPGIGESMQADKEYYAWYRDMIVVSHCIVYVLRADQRDFSLDLQLWEAIMEQDYSVKNKLVVALNYADKIEPINRSGFISALQLERLEQKKRDVVRKFNIPSDRVVYYSAADNYNCDKLMDSIADRLQIFA